MFLVFLSIRGVGTTRFHSIVVSETLWDLELLCRNRGILRGPSWRLKRACESEYTMGLGKWGPQAVSKANMSLHDKVFYRASFIPSIPSYLRHCLS